MSATPKLVGMACALVFGLGCASRVSPPPPAPDPMNRDAYVIGNSDMIQVSVWKNPELSVVVPVRNDGKISVPLLDDVQAEGLTPIELKEVITQQLSEFVANPDVTVIVTQQNSKRIYVMGAVQRPGGQGLTTEMRVLDALALAGGFNTFADKDDVRILRRSGSEIVEYRFDYDAYLSGRNPESNLVLMPGDTIVVTE